jgi:hypothetical protein
MNTVGSILVRLLVVLMVFRKPVVRKPRRK